jgi:hypothetical protein
MDSLLLGFERILPGRGLAESRRTGYLGGISPHLPELRAGGT